MRTLRGWYCLTVRQKRGYLCRTGENVENQRSRTKGDFYMKRKVSLLLAAALCISLAGTGCGNDSKKASNSGKKEVDASGEVTLPVTGSKVPGEIFKEPFNLTYASVRTGGSDEIMEVFEKLKDIPGCTATNKYFSADDLDSQMNLALTAGDGNCPYELFRISLRNYRDFASKDQLLPLDEYMDKYEEIYNFADIPESVWEPLREFDNIYGLPLTVNVQHMFYRSDIFKKYNLTPPKTIDDLLEICETLKDCGDVEYPIAFALDKGNGAATEFTNMMYAADQDFFDENENPIFNQEAGVECLEKLKKLASYCPPGVTSMTNDDVMVLMQTGQIAMMNTWASRAPYMEDETVSDVVGLIDYSPAPLYAEGKYPLANLSTDYMVIPKNIKGDPEETFLAVAELASEEAQTTYLKSSFVARQKPLSLYEGEPQPNAEAVNETVRQGAQVGHYHPAFGPSWSIISTYVAMALDGEMTSQEALDQAAKECVVVLKDSGIIKE